MHHSQQPISRTGFTAPHSLQQTFAEFFSRMPDTPLRHQRSTEEALRKDYYFVGNEKISPALFNPAPSGIQNVGGVLVGCGLGMPMHLAHLARAERMFIIDIDPVSTTILWPMMLMHFANSATRVDFIANILSEPLSHEQRRQCNRSPANEIASFLLTSNPDSPLAPRLNEISDEFVKSIRPHSNSCYSDDVIKALFSAFTIRLRQTLNDPRLSTPDSPHIKESMQVISYLPALSCSAQHSFLSSEREYQWMRNFLLSEKLIVTTSDMMSETFDTILDEHQVCSPRIIYIDNLSQIAPWNDFDGAYLHGMARIQRRLQADSTVIASVRAARGKAFYAAPLSALELELLNLEKYRGDDGAPDDIGSEFLGLTQGLLTVNRERLRESEGRVDIFRKTLEGDTFRLCGYESFFDYVCQHLEKTTNPFQNTKQFWDFVNKRFPDKGPWYTFPRPFARLVEVGLYLGRFLEDPAETV